MIRALHGSIPAPLEGTDARLRWRRQPICCSERGTATRKRSMSCSAATCRRCAAGRVAGSLRWTRDVSRHRRCGAGNAGSDPETPRGRSSLGTKGPYRHTCVRRWSIGSATRCDGSDGTRSARPDRRRAPGFHRPRRSNRRSDAKPSERYEAALHRLRPEEREVIIARVELGQSYQQIAAGHGKASADAARMAVSRALVRLAEEMDVEG